MNAGDGFYACMFTFTGGLKTDGLEDDGITQKYTDYDEAEVVATLQAFSKLIHDYKGTFQSLSIDAISSGFSQKSCGAVSTVLGTQFLTRKLLATTSVQLSSQQSM